MSAIVKFYVLQIKMKKMTIDDVSKMETTSY